MVWPSCAYLLSGIKQYSYSLGPATFYCFAGIAQLWHVFFRKKRLQEQIYVSASAQCNEFR